MRIIAICMVWEWTGCIFIWVVTVLETVFILSRSAVKGAFGIKDFGRWLYIAMQDMAWVKWGN